jgi:hypothetical protein
LKYPLPVAQDFGSSVTLLQAGGTVANTTIHVRYSPGASATGATGSLSITNASTGATTQNVSVSGKLSLRNLQQAGTV